MEIEAMPTTKMYLKKIKYGEGFCSQFLKDGEPIIVNSTSADWQSTYIGAWHTDYPIKL